jgi:phosphoserine aminotransferase
MLRKEGVRQRGSRLLGEEQRPRVEVPFVIAKDTLDQAVAAAHRSSGIHIQRQHRMFRDARREQCWR